MSIYLDNAATSYPRPETVYQAVDRTLREFGASPGRGGYRMALESSRLIYEVREQLAALFAIPDAARLVFTSSCTEALNLALFGLLAPGDRVVTSGMEHNAVARPLQALAHRGVEVVKVTPDSEGRVSADDLRAACTDGTRLLMMIHASNVTGAIQPLDVIGPWCREQGILVAIDAAQSAGLLEIDVEKLGIDLLAVAGHKGLFGPPGTGALYVREGLTLQPLIYGGTGSGSESLEPPQQMPERFESGTLNTPGIAGLGAGLAYLQEQGLEQVAARKRAQVAQLLDGLTQIQRVKLYGPRDPQRHAGAISFMLDGQDPSETGFLLDQEFDIACRVGLHCAPEAHRGIGTFPTGTVRVSPGFATTPTDIERFLDAIYDLAARPV
ncbi:MAG: cysteine desulfurase [Desulfuromonas sp.]|nr:MAG: cysteine desulfurase [Desulfuromonas sp.]